MISVIIIDYHSYSRTIEYLKHLPIKLKNYNKLNMIIVDNSNSDENFNNLNIQIEKEFHINKFCQISRKPVSIKGKVDEMYTFNISDDVEIITVKAKDNYGFAISNNIGVNISREYCNDKYLILSNNDILIEDDIDFNKIDEYFKQDERIACIGPYVRGLDGVRQSPHKKINIWNRWIIPFGLWPINALLKKLKVANIRPTDIIEASSNQAVYRLIGAFMIVDKNKFIECGMFDENTFLYGEELILAERLLQKGYKTFYVHELSIIHEQPYKKDNFLNNEKQMMTQFKSELYYYKHYTNINDFEYYFAKFSMWSYVNLFMPIKYQLKKR